MTARFEVYKDKIGEFRWRLTHTNGHIIANSGEGYTTKSTQWVELDRSKRMYPARLLKIELFEYPGYLTSVNTCVVSLI